MVRGLSALDATAALRSAAPPGAAASRSPVVLFGSDGLTQGFPPNTGQGWYPLATDASESYPATANSFRVGGDDRDGRVAKQ